PDPSMVSSHHMHVKKSEGLGNIGVAYNPNYIISLAVDRNGTVWAGTWGAGLARFDGKKWRNYTTADGLPGNHIFMLYLDPKGRLWIGTDHGLSRLKKDGKGFTTMTAADGLYADDVFSMDFAKDGSVWVGSFGGLSHITSKL
ncbi:MAG TPA: two-component regulator propeller domain-containing protein, partial [Pseudodesulfovibrio sp.]|nr:two-component regulator propeller domain-containing protein [Pseudodesulfovibrio sp.]